MNSRTHISTLKAIPSTILAILCMTTQSVVGAAPPDLQLKVKTPKEIQAGTPFNVKVGISNQGEQTARGNNSNSKGYVVDLTLNQKKPPQGLGHYSKTYFDGVLLRGGRISNTDDVTRKKSRVYKLETSIPADTPAGKYKICAQVDSTNQIKESNEKNNLSCRKVMVTTKLNIVDLNGAEFKPVENKLPVFTLGGSRASSSGKSNSPSSRTVLRDGTMEIRLPNGSIQRRDLNGEITIIYPDGRMSSMKAMQVQLDELPPLPSQLDDWGQKTSDSLLAIIRNLLTNAEFSAYQLTEFDKDFYEKMNWRLDSIKFLTRAE